MKNINQHVIASFSFLIALIFIGCTKQMTAPTRESPTDQQTSGYVTQSVMFNDITINSLQSHTFSIPGVTQAVINSGSVSVFATTTSNSTAQWQSLPTIYGCDLHLNVTVGQATIQNNIGNPVTMSFRFDITAN